MKYIRCTGKSFSLEGINFFNYPKKNYSQTNLFIQLKQFICFPRYFFNWLKSLQQNNNLIAPQNVKNNTVEFYIAHMFGNQLIVMNIERSTNDKNEEYKIVCEGGKGPWSYRVKGLPLGAYYNGNRIIFPPQTALGQYVLSIQARDTTGALVQRYYSLIVTTVTNVISGTKAPQGAYPWMAGLSFSTASQTNTVRQSSLPSAATLNVAQPSDVRSSNLVSNSLKASANAQSKKNIRLVNISSSSILSNPSPTTNIRK